MMPLFTADDIARLKQHIKFQSGKLAGETARANKLQKENDRLRNELVILQSQKEIVISIKGDNHG
jgi:hypothetical protein